MGLLLPLLLRARPVRIQVGQDPLTQQPNRTRIGRPGMLKQRGLHRSGMLGPVGCRDGFDRLGDRSRMLRPDLTGSERPSGSRKDRIERLTGQTAPGTEPLHRLRPLARLHPSAPQLGTDRIRQPTKPERARHVPRFSSANTANCRYCNRESSASNSPSSASSCVIRHDASCSITCSILLIEQRKTSRTEANSLISQRRNKPANG